MTNNQKIEKAIELLIEVLDKPKKHDFEPMKTQNLVAYYCKSEVDKSKKPWKLSYREHFNKKHIGWYATKDEAHRTAIEIENKLKSLLS